MRRRRRQRGGGACAAGALAYLAPCCCCCFLEAAHPCGRLTHDAVSHCPCRTACLRPAAARLPRRRRCVAAAAAAADGKPQRRVVVTGQGVVTSLGHTPDEFYNNLLAGKSGISMIEGWDTSESPLLLGSLLRLLPLGCSS